MEKQLIWKIYTKEETERLAAAFAAAIDGGQVEKILPFVRDPQLARSLVVRRGEGNKYFILLEKAVTMLLGKKLETANSNLEGVIEYFHKQDISEQILNELENIAFHKRDKDKFFQIVDYIKNNESRLENKNVLARAIHDTASWFSAHGEFARALAENKHALELARKYGEPVIELKAKFGLTHDKIDLKSKLQAEDFLHYAEELAAHGLSYDSIQSKIEAARTLLQSALLQERNLREQKMSEAKNIALDALRSAKDIQYPNAEIRAREVLGQIYAEMEENRKLKSYKRGADKIRQDFDYKSTPLTK